MSHAKKQSLVVTASGDRSIHDVARELSKAGFEVEQILDSINVITGKGPSGSKDKFRSLPGIADVSEDQPVDIGPPDSDVS